MLPLLDTRRWSSPSPGVGKIRKTRSSSVISKILQMFGSAHAIATSPPSGRSRRTAPMRTPSVVESMNVAPERSTRTDVAPVSIAAFSASLSSGAV